MTDAVVGAAPLAATTIPAGPVDLVLEGGGVKGIGLVGAILALDRAGYRIKRVAGTSAGAIVASIVAALQAKSQPLSDLRGILETIDYGRFKQNSGLRGKLGAAGEASGLLLHMGMFDGDYLIEWLGGVLANIGVTHFSDLPLADADQFPDAAPGQRFSLVVHTSDITRGRVVRLPWDYEAYGLEPANQRVVDAVRASMAIPFFFEPVRFRAPAADFGGQECPASTVVWVDGGMLDNYPLDVFSENQGLAATWPTIGVKLSAKAPVIKSSKVDDVAGEAVACLHTLLDNADRYYVDGSKAQRTIFVDSVGITATDFDLSKSQQDTLFANGQQAAQQWIASQSSTAASA